MKTIKLNTFELIPILTLVLSVSIIIGSRIERVENKKYYEAIIYSLEQTIVELEQHGYDYEDHNAAEWETWMLATAWVESQWNDNAVGDDGRAAGFLQLWEDKVQDANEWVGEERYTLEDRLNRQKSIEIYNIIAERYNPDHDLHLQLKIWNSRAPLSYHKAVEAKYNELMKGK